jgi:hypothetical protein
MIPPDLMQHLVALLVQSALVSNAEALRSGESASAECTALVVALLQVRATAIFATVAVPTRA